MIKKYSNSELVPLANDSTYDNGLGGVAGLTHNAPRTAGGGDVGGARPANCPSLGDRGGFRVSKAGTTRLLGSGEVAGVPAGVVRPVLRALMAQNSP